MQVDIRHLTDVDETTVDTEVSISIPTDKPPNSTVVEDDYQLAGQYLFPITVEIEKNTETGTIGSEGVISSRAIVRCVCENVDVYRF